MHIFTTVHARMQPSQWQLNPCRLKVIRAPQPPTTLHNEFSHTAARRRTCRASSGNGDVGVAGPLPEAELAGLVVATEMGVVGLLPEAELAVAGLATAMRAVAPRAIGVGRTVVDSLRADNISF